jgi:hypothetical protein
MIAFNYCDRAPVKAGTFCFWSRRRAYRDTCGCNELSYQQTTFLKEAKIVKQVTASKRGPGQSAIVAGEETAVASSGESSITAI